MSHQHDGNCSCDSSPTVATDPAELERLFADNLRSRAQTYLTPEHAPIARQMLVAARSLLALHDGLNGEKLVWLLVAEAHLPMLDGKTEDALKTFQAALDIAEKSVGEDHLGTAVCAINIADTLLELNRGKEAKPLYERAHAIFLKVAAEYKGKDEYLSKFAEDGSALALLGSEVAQDSLAPADDSSAKPAEKPADEPKK